MSSPALRNCSRRAAPLGTDDGSSPHHPTARGTAHDVIGHRIICHVVGGLGIYVCTFGDRWRGGGRTAQLLAQGGQPLPKTRAEEAVVAHFDEAFGQDVLQEAADELLGGKGAGSEFAGVGSCYRPDSMSEIGPIPAKSNDWNLRDRQRLEMNGHTG
jgi:hypothetical protein